MVVIILVSSQGANCKLKPDTGQDDCAKSRDICSVTGYRGAVTNICDFSCLLFSVILTLWFQFPDGESASPYVFICTNPQELMLKFPMKGQHKICEYRINLSYLKKLHLAEVLVI